MTVNRKKMKEQMLARSQESYATKDKGDKYGTFFKSTPGINFWKCGEADHTMDILTWIVGTQYPSAEPYHNVKEGDFAYVLDLWIHRKVGIEENSYACPLKNWGERCPICEDIVDMVKNDVEDEELIKNRKAKRRSIYYILCYDSPQEEGKGVQIWEVSHVFMQKILASRSKLPGGGGTVLFALPDEEGKQVFFRRKGMGMTSTEYTDHQFLDRDYTIPDEIWMDLTPLDELIHKPSFEELYEAHFGSPYEETTTRKPVQKPAATQSTEETKVPPVRTRVPLKKPTPAAKAPAAKKPAPATRIQRAAKSAPVTEEPVVETPEGTPEGTGDCPGGGVFGVDIDQMDHCPQCENWDDCAAEANRLEEEQK